MKSFFKKLSLVLVAAMVLTLIPAQNAKAAGTIVLADQLATSSAEQITVLDLKKGETKNLKFYGCTDYKTTGIRWASSNEAVATVDNEGIVTAVAAGAAQIEYLATGYVCEPVTVVVADEYDVCIALQKETEPLSAVTLKANDEVDYRFLGAKGYDLKKHQCKWISTNEAVATVDNKGNVKAVADGVAKIVLTIVDKTTGAVAFSVAPLEVTVKTDVLEVVQKTYKTFEVTFNGAPVDGEKLEVESVMMYTDTNDEIIKEYVDVNGKTVTFYNEVVDGRIYKFTYPGVKEPVVKTGSNGKLASFDIKYSSKYFGAGDDVDSKAYAEQLCTIKATNFADANGVLLDDSDFTYMYVDVCTDKAGNKTETTYYDGEPLYVAEGTHHDVTVVVYDKNLNEVGKNTTNFDATAPDAWKFETKQMAMGKEDTAFADCKESKLSIDDYGATARALALKLTDNYGNVFTCAAGHGYEVKSSTSYGDIENELQYYGQVVFESSNPDVLSVTDAGLLEPHQAGKSATIFAYLIKTYDVEGDAEHILLAAKKIEVVGHLYPSTFAVKNANSNTPGISKSFARLSDTAGACNFDTVELEFTLQDQLGRDMNQAIISFEAFDQNTKAKLSDAELDARFSTHDYNKFTADDITAAVENQNTRIDFTAKNDYGSKKISYNIVVGNLEKCKLKEEVGIVWCKETGHTMPLGLGNTDVKGSDAKVMAYAHIVDVYACAGAYIYGNATTKTIEDYNGAVGTSTFAKLSTKDRYNYYIANDTDGDTFNFIATDTVFVDVTVKGSGIDGVKTTFNVATKFIEVEIRDAYGNLAGDAFEDAVALSKILERTVDVNAYRYVNTNTNSLNQNYTTWNIRRDSAYDNADPKTLKNNDVANYNAKIDWKNLTYFGDTPDDKLDWYDWLTDHTTFGYWWDSVNNKAYTSVHKGYPDFATKVDVITPTQYSKYITSVDIFVPYGATGLYTYLPQVANKKISAANYEYKVEADGTDGESR